MSGSKRKADDVGEFERIVKHGEDWRPRTRAEKRVVFSKPVLETAELLEQILLGVSMKRLFVLQRVNKVWRDAIANSKSLRQKMYLEACARPAKPEEPGYDPAEDDPLYHIGFHPNPAATAPLCVRRAWDRPMFDNSAQFGMWYGTAFPMENPAFYFRVSTTRSTNESWYKTLITQPPLVAVQLWYQLSLLSGEVVSYMLYNPTGITWGDLRDNYDRNITSGRDLSDTYVCVEESAQSEEIRYALENCTGKKDWDGLCGCVWLLCEEQGYEKEI